MIKNKILSELEIRAYRANGTDLRTQNLAVTAAVISYKHQKFIF